MGIVVEGRVIVDHENNKVPMAMLIYEDGSRKPMAIPAKYITNRDDTGDFSIICDIDEIITVPRKRIEIYTTQGTKASDVL